MHYEDVKIGMRVKVLWANGTPKGTVIDLQDHNGWYRIQLDMGGYISAHPNAMSPASDPCPTSCYAEGECICEPTRSYLESLDEWSPNVSDTELINEYNRLSNEISDTHSKIDAIRHELGQMEASLRVSESHERQVTEEINKRGLFGSDETPEGPEQYYGIIDRF